VDFNGLKKYIEHCERCMTAFLRGFADSEGCVNKSGYIIISNTDYELLTYIKDLLKRLGIESTGPWPIRLQGKTFYDHKTMKKYPYNKDCYYLYIRVDYNKKFYKMVGFIIQRKRKRPIEYLKRLGKH
jgi:intein-encoded DNA endonuclease-like protein